MLGSERVNPDPGVWLPLLEEYELTTLPGDTLLRGTLLAGLDVDSPEVRKALEAWPGQAHLSADEDGVDVVLVYQLKRRDRPPLTIHVVLFLLTLITTLGSGALMADVDPFHTRLLELGDLQLPYPSGLSLPRLAAGFSFALPFLGVLLAHEMSHVWAARRHGVRASLPYFIPFPPYFSLIGSLGAFIRLKGPTVRRASLFDIGASGPLGSFLLSIPLLIVGLSLSDAVPGPATLSTP
ncbi:MAG: site-2 protease family protein, partial [Longimicrobiales bacterium]|nr:site-2 protease family protein [Longimicrobiales bacterium]